MGIGSSLVSLRCAPPDITFAPVMNCCKSGLITNVDQAVLRV